MVTRIYTPLLPPYKPQNQRPVDGLGRRNEEEKPASGFSQTVREESAREEQQPSLAPRQQGSGQGQAQPQKSPFLSPLDSPVTSPFASVQQQQAMQVITLGTVLSDFRSTMAALGVEEPLTREVNTYLDVVERQGRKENPSIPLIKQSLRTAADTLDGYIAQQLNQPSQVVRDWVEALLLQKLDYRVDALGTAVPAVAENSPTTDPLTPADTGDAPPDLSREDKQTLHGWIRESKLRAWSGDYGGAVGLLRRGLDLLTGKNRLDVEGKLFHLLGNVHGKAEAVPDAVEAYQEAVHRFETVNLPEKKGRTLYAMARLLDRHGELDPAAEQYRQALAVQKTLENPAQSARILNDLGSVLLRQGESPRAVKTFLDAYTEAVRPGSDASLLPDVFSNLGSAYRSQRHYAKATRAYHTSLRYARQQQDIPGYAASLRNLGALYLETQQPDRARVALAQADRLQQSMSS